MVPSTLNAKGLLAFVFLVKEAVQRAELDASLAAEDAVRHGHKAEARVTGNKGSSEHTEGSTDHVTGDDKLTLHVRTHASLGTLDSFNCLIAILAKFCLICLR